MNIPTSLCLVVPAIKKNAVIPDQLVKRLAGKTLIQRALDTAKGVIDGDHIWVVTDSDEIRLICERNDVACIYNKDFTITSLDIVASLRSVLEELAQSYEHCIIYRASSPLITATDIKDAYQRFLTHNSDCLVTVKSIKYRLWKEKENDLDALLFEDAEQVAYVETKALFMLRMQALFHTLPAGSVAHPTSAASLKVTPYFLNDRSIEINSYQDWWICEKLLQSKHIVFVVAGYAAIGMGHIYRALMLAHEIADHRITFICTRESELAASSIAAKDYRTKTQQSESLAETVLAEHPDLVVNDILNTSATYMQALKSHNIPVVNFEDEGEGTPYADLIVNALYENNKSDDPRFLCGHNYFCLRDEFLHATQNTFRPTVKRILITFGGTDNSNYTQQTLNALLPLCAQHHIEIVIVTGPGYLYKEELTAHIASLSTHAETPSILFTHATNVMSGMMEGIDIAISSAGRTVYELAHMRIPAIVLSHHAREDMHTFARPANGFIYLGIMNPFDAERLLDAFGSMLRNDVRLSMYNKLASFDFTHNKAHVIQDILALFTAKDTA